MRRRETACRILAMIVITVMLVTASACIAFAGPLVLKDKEKGIGVEENVERDRSLQDGSLVYSLTPVYPEDFDEGAYDIEAVSSSQFFKITGVELTNSGTDLNAVLTISSTSYAYVYPGTAMEAAAADKSEWIAADETTGYGQFAIEAEALNKEMPLAAFSKKKQQWYDRDIVLLADSLPDGVLHVELSEDGGTIADTQEAAVKVIYIALGIIVIGGVLNFFIKKKYYE